MSEFIKDIGNLHLKMLNNIAIDIAREEREKKKNKKIFNSVLIECMDAVEVIKLWQRITPLLKDNNWWIRLDHKEYENMMQKFKNYTDNLTEKAKYHLETSANKTPFCDDVLNIIISYL